MAGSSETFGEVWVGDLLHAIAHTTAGDAQTCLRWAVELLGLDPRLANIGTPTTKAPRVESTAADPVAATSRKAEAPDRPTTPPPTDVPDTPLPYEIVRTHYVSPSVGEVPDWYARAEDLDQVDEEQVERRPPFRPLFPHRTTRALLSTALATPNGEGEIDLELIIDRIARLQPLASFPRTRLSTMRFGIQLLVDRGEGMLPFRRDQEKLYEDIHEVVGRDRVQPLFFDDSPLRTVDGGDPFGRQWRYEPPTQGTPVVMLTDLGMAGRRSAAFGASEREWLRFARLVRGAECPLLAVTPYGPERTPRRLRDAMYVLPWDRVTNVSLVRRIVGHGLELARQS